MVRRSMQKTTEKRAPRLFPINLRINTTFPFPSIGTMATSPAREEAFFCERRRLISTTSTPTGLRDVATLLQAYHDGSRSEDGVSGALYDTFSVSVVDSPKDLPGIGWLSDGVLLDVGGVPNMDNVERHDVQFDLDDLVENTSPASAFASGEGRESHQNCGVMILGALAAAPCVAGCNAEGIMCCELVAGEDGERKSRSASKYTKITSERPWSDATVPISHDGFVQRLELPPVIPPSGPGGDGDLMVQGQSRKSRDPFCTRDYAPLRKLGCLGNFFLATRIRGENCETATAQNQKMHRSSVLKVHARRRLKGGAVHSFTQWLRDAFVEVGQRLLEQQSSISSTDSKPGLLPALGFGGVVFVKSGFVQGHVMPDFLPHKIENATMCNDWLRFFLNGPGNCVMFTTMLGVSKEVSEANSDLHLRPEHTHFFGVGATASQEGGGGIFFGRTASSTTSSAPGDRDGTIENQGGHYHGDVDLEQLSSLVGDGGVRQAIEGILAEKGDACVAEYVAYLAPAHELVRVNDAVKMISMKTSTGMSKVVPGAGNANAAPGNKILNGSNQKAAKL